MNLCKFYFKIVITLVGREHHFPWSLVKLWNLTICLIKIAEQKNTDETRIFFVLQCVRGQFCGFVGTLISAAADHFWGDQLLCQSIRAFLIKALFYAIIIISLFKVIGSLHLLPHFLQRVKFVSLSGVLVYLSLIHIWRCRRLLTCRSRWSPYH